MAMCYEPHEIPTTGTWNLEQRLAITESHADHPAYRDEVALIRNELARRRAARKAT